MKKKIVVLSGAGISAESGIKTFRDADGLWEGHDVMEVASPQGWKNNQALVLDFYNQRRRQLLTVKPNIGHLALVELESKYDVVIVTQNVDDLHERAGSKNIIHLHGELLKVRSENAMEPEYEWRKDLASNDKAKDGSQLRPAIVWFGESVPRLEAAIREIEDADIVIIVGTSMQVYPAASLVSYAPQNAQIFYVDPNPKVSHELSQLKNLRILPMKGTEGLSSLVNKLMD